MSRGRCITAALSLVTLLLGIMPAAVQAQGNLADGSNDSVFRPADRELRQTLLRAQRAIDEGQFSDAITSLGKLLSEGATEDAFVPAADNPSERSSLKAEAEQMLATLPQRGRELYELNFGSESKALLAEGIQQRNVNLITEVTRRFFLTRAGQEAAILLGRLHLDQGRPLSAALMFRRVREVPSSRTAYDPELSMLLATAWSFAHRPEQAREVLAELARNRQPIKIDGKDVPMFRPAEDSLEWLGKLVGTAAAPRTNRLHQWCVFGGDESRNASIAAGMPLADLRWKAITAEGPREEQEIRLITRRLVDKGEAPLPALQPLAVGDTVLIRTTNQLVAINATTGKLAWEPALKSRQEPTMRTAGNNVRNLEAQRQGELEQRLFEDSAYGQISSDGEAVFYLHDLRPVAAPNIRRMVLIGGRPAMNPLFPNRVNLLVALDVKKQGKLKFMVGNESGEDDPALANVFFLGPPLPHQGELLVLLEKQGEIRLAALNSQTGLMEWSQQIATMDEQFIDQDPIRRLAGVSPSFSDGLVICPTAGGAVVAVDWARRALSWGYSYNRDAAPAISPSALIASRMNANNSSPAWPVSNAIIAEGHVVLTPPDSNELHCLDLLTGKPVWAPLQRKDALEGALYVACVRKGQIVMVCKDGIKNIELKTGKVTTLPQVDFTSSLPSGRGVYSDPYYYLPLSSAELLKIQLDDGTIAERLTTDRPLGNLVVHDVDLISLSADALTTYYLRDPLKTRIEERLAADPADAWALARKGEILVQEGNTEEALKLLREAHHKLPDEQGIRNTLLKLLISAVKEDYAKHASLTAEIEQLIEQPAERAAFLRVCAPGLAKAGATKDAFEAYLSLAVAMRLPSAMADNDEAFEEVDRQWRVRTDRWLSTQLASLYRSAAPDLQGKMDEMIAQRLAAEMNPQALDSFRRLLRFHPATLAEQLKLAEKALESGNLLQAEYELTPLTQIDDPKIAAPAYAMLAKLLASAKRPIEAQAVYKKIQRDYRDVVLNNDDVGADLLAIARNLPLLESEADQPFQGTHVASKVEPEASSRFRSYQRLLPISIASEEGLLFDSPSVIFDHSRNTVVVGDGYGRTVSEALLNQEGGSTRLYFNLMSASSYGHLLTLSMGTEVIAIDTLRGITSSMPAGRGGESVLWRYDTIELAPNSPYVGYGMHQRQLRNPLAGQTPIYTDQNGNPMGAKVVMGPWGCVFFRSRQLVCVDPLTGKTLWERSGLDAGSDVFGDDEHLFVVPFDETEATVYSAWDGSQLGKRTVEKFEQRWTNCQGNVLSWKEAGDKVEVRLVDLWDGKELWKKQFTSGAKGCLPAPDEVAVMEPASGKVEIISLRTGEILFQHDLQPEPNLAGLIVQRSSDHYFIMPGHPSQEPAGNMNYHPAPQGINTALTTGWIYAFDRTSGQSLWPAPAYVQQQGYVVNQPTEMPVLLFLRHATPSSRNSGSKTVTTPLAIDKRTGAVVLEDDFPAPIHAFEVAADPRNSKVQLTIYAQSQRTYTLTFDDEPTPPQAPAQQGVYSSLTAGGKRGRAVNVAGAVFDALNNAFGPRESAPVPQPAPAP